MAGRSDAAHLQTSFGDLRRSRSATLNRTKSSRPRSASLASRASAHDEHRAVAASLAAAGGAGGDGAAVLAALHRVRGPREWAGVLRAFQRHHPGLAGGDVRKHADDAMRDGERAQARALLAVAGADWDDESHAEGPEDWEQVRGQRLAAKARRLDALAARQRAEEESERRDAEALERQREANVRQANELEQREAELAQRTREVAAKELEAQRLAERLVAAKALQQQEESPAPRREPKPDPMLQSDRSLRLDGPRPRLSAAMLVEPEPSQDSDAVVLRDDSSEGDTQASVPDRASRGRDVSPVSGGDLLAEWEAQKARAVAVEDFVTAARLKKRVDRQRTRLEQAKRRAVASEDYELAAAYRAALDPKARRQDEPETGRWSQRGQGEEQPRRQEPAAPQPPAAAVHPGWYWPVHASPVQPEPVRMWPQPAAMQGMPQPAAMQGMPQQAMLPPGGMLAGMVPQQGMMPLQGMMPGMPPQQPGYAWMPAPDGTAQPWPHVGEGVWRSPPQEGSGAKVQSPAPQPVDIRLHILASPPHRDRHRRRRGDVSTSSSCASGHMKATATGYEVAPLTATALLQAPTPRPSAAHSPAPGPSPARISPFRPRPYGGSARQPVQPHPGEEQLRSVRRPPAGHGPPRPGQALPNDGYWERFVSTWDRIEGEVTSEVQNARPPDRSLSI
eukprot:TRINITY_DN4640_c0_g1_i1.p1 TRINITY_DN4640_c0_g1~~TRINITY_DN4640_c0_g1_i1.p1  ORF type:complete len:677 (+),score=155.78 TRINITY_DN4640_c0_g1_i1:77-2107(+)